MTEIQKRCAACGSEKIIPLATITNKTTGPVKAAQGEPEIVIRRNQHFSIFTLNSVSSRIHAWVCGECGYMPLFADDPQALYEAYQDFLRATRQ